MALELPAAPATGIVRDPHGIEWRRGADDIWHPQPCPSCETRMSSLSWAELLGRGPLAEMT